MGRPAFLYRLMMLLYKPARWIERFRPRRVRSTDENSSSHVIPVNESVSPGGGHVLPLKIIAPLVMRADAIAIMDECLCRRGERCKKYPADLGCLLLGPAARELARGMGTIVGPDRALAHAERAIKMGLVPLVVHNEFDAWLWGIDYRRMLNVCFCCDCCCSVRRGVRVGIDEGARHTMRRLPNLSVAVGEACDGCGACEAVCFAHAIRMAGGRAFVDESLCKGCGRCVEKCPFGAIHMDLDPASDVVRVIGDLYERRTDFARPALPPPAATGHRTRTS
jgi:Fe-S-cluster-containing hydrogenase component 2